MFSRSPQVTWHILQLERPLPVCLESFFSTLVHEVGKHLTAAPSCGDLFFRSSDEFVQCHWGKRERENVFVFSWIHSGCCHLMIASEQTLDGNIKWIISVWFIFFYTIVCKSKSMYQLKYFMLCELFKINFHFKVFFQLFSDFETLWKLTAFIFRQLKFLLLIMI